MAQRDLTAQFVSLRDAFNARKGPRRRKRFGNNVYQDVEMGEQFGRTGDESFSSAAINQSPQWVSAAEEVKKVMSDIETRIKTLNQLHKNRLLVRFDNSEDLKDREIDSVTQEITKKFRTAEQIIKHKIIDSQGNAFVNKSSAEYVVKENVRQQMAQDLQKLSISFRTTQKEYMQQLRSQKGDSGLEDILGIGHTSNSRTGQAMFGDNLLLETMEQSTQALDRDREIQKIAENVNELATIFQDLATLVIDQGTILDRIDYNLENVQIKTEKGLEELRIADRYSENSKPFQCIMILIGIIVFECLILIFQNSN